MEIFKYVDVQDCFVLAWHVLNDQLVFEVEASIWPGHRLYEKPEPKLFTCYRKARLIFHDVEELAGLVEMGAAPPSVDPDGSIDYGEVETLESPELGRFEMSGDFGDVSFRSSGVDLQFEIEQERRQFIV